MGSSSGREAEEQTIDEKKNVESSTHDGVTGSDVVETSAAAPEEAAQGAHAGETEARQRARAWCEGCKRPEKICVCSALPDGGPLDTRSKVVIFIHPKEVKRAMGTAPLLQFCLKNIMLYEADRFPEPDEDPALHAALCEGGRQPVLVCPGPDAEELRPPVLAEGDVCAPADPPRTLIFVDGRWPQAKGMVHKSTWLQEKLPRVVLVPTEQSGYTFRKQPAQGCLSTLEAVGEALLALEGSRGPSLKAALAAPFRRMVDLQCEFIPDIQDKNVKSAAIRRRFDAAALAQHPHLAPPPLEESAAVPESADNGPVGLRVPAIHCIVRWGEKDVAGRGVIVVEILRVPLDEAKQRATDLSKGKSRGQRFWVLPPDKVPPGSLCEAPEGVPLNEEQDGATAA